jgi:tartrate-resistant acid phosphatase type 5
MPIRDSSSRIRLRKNLPQRFAPTLILIFGFVLLRSCGPVREWIGIEAFDSVVENARPVPSFEVPMKDPGISYVQFVAVGDAGTGRRGQREVAESMARVAAEDTAQFVLFLGDNFYESGVSSVSDPQWQTKFEDVYVHPSLQIPFYAVLGNHDYRLNPRAQIEYTSLSTRWRMPNSYYTFMRPLDDSTTVQFFCIDTYPLSKEKLGDTATLSGYSRTQLRWLERELTNSSARWKIVVGHHTVYSGADYHGDDPNLASALEPLFVTYGVDIYLCGHDHHQEILQPAKGVHYIISGGGGKHRDVTWRDNTIFAATNLGFTSFRVSRNDLLVRFFSRSGNLDFAYTISK